MPVVRTQMSTFQNSLQGDFPIICIDGVSSSQEKLFVKRDRLVPFSDSPKLAFHNSRHITLQNAACDATGGCCIQGSSVDECPLQHPMTLESLYHIQDISSITIPLCLNMDNFPGPFKGVNISFIHMMVFLERKVLRKLETFLNLCFAIVACWTNYTYKSKKVMVNSLWCLTAEEQSGFCLTLMGEV